MAVTVQRVIMPEDGPWHGEGQVLIGLDNVTMTSLGPSRLVIDRDTARQFADDLTELLDEWSLEDQGISNAG